MYKVFINDRSLILTDDYADYSSAYDTLFITYASEEAFFELIELLRDSPVLKSVCVYHSKLDDLWNVFCNKYSQVSAAGGIVQNKDRILFIFKNNHWDLPKGKIENGEASETAALREVKEECGLKDLSLKAAHATTYYLFTEKGNTLLKKTEWFLMDSAEEGPLTGDEKEGITDVKWMDSASWKTDQQNSFASVINMLDSLL
ncbi:MAG TPA: NUDIX hydrolase [Flavobacteriales bacterium]|nr:NUDIX hydrolase [Flavobacteriales bacterium]